MYSAILICNLRDFSHVLQILNTCFPKSTPGIIAKFMGYARSPRCPHNSVVPNIMDLFRNKLALNSIENYASPRPKDPLVPASGLKGGEEGPGRILNLEIRASIRW